MPKIGAPVSDIQSQLRNVGMTKDPNEKSREQIIEKISGKKIGKDIVKRTPHNKVGKDEFLKMLTYQLQNQDPLKPMDQNKFAADLAQFSQLEQLTTMNKKFDDMNTNASIEKKFLAASFVGKSVVADGNTIELKKDGEDKNIHFSLDKKAKQVLVRILDSKNNIANEIKLQDMGAGTHELTWDGMAMDNFESPAGIYKIAVLAWDESAMPIKTQTRDEGIVQSVAFDPTSNEPIFDIGSRKINMRDVVSFHIPKEANNKLETPKANIQKFKEMAQGQAKEMH
ncbi:MAG: hypothetical protein H6621_12700 [Halobacteriovoraceae bacterium]|nr:hypothetical protein [Halobacteriovoraceae bacterium]MCB9095920.1 hypothetical protein [Halobacteriovoraceae bacterium]